MDSTRNAGLLLPKRRFPGLYEIIRKAFDGRQCFVFPDDSVLQRQREEITVKVLGIILPFYKNLPKPKTEYYRISKGQNGSFACHVMPESRLLFEINASDEALEGTAIPMQVYSYLAEQGREKAGESA